ncbi:hypothetical protein E2C01_046445 [Portunus trituberculatus]|uniref:Uncharacterized protein n=1 Tax=Portunus trituberculatus TaxID=210409 RepID=A0A5B7G7S1_PORTR|nr:hypothetical protein [Portunus trituberculatus]
MLILGLACGGRGEGWNCVGLVKEWEQGSDEGKIGLLVVMGEAETWVVVRGRGGLGCEVGKKSGGEGTR